MGVRQCLGKLPSAGAFVGLVFMSGLVSGPQPASAHHSFTYLLTPDGEETIQIIEGSVRVFRILNPHGAMIVDVPTESGETEG